MKQKTERECVCVFVCTHFMELFLIPLGASFGYVCVSVCVWLLCQLRCPVLCRAALWEGRSSGVCRGSAGRASITKLCVCVLSLSLSVPPALSFYVRMCE